LALFTDFRSSKGLTSENEVGKGIKEFLKGQVRVGGTRLFNFRSV